ncbi:restriction endonuclease subunit S [Vibrio metoecus]|uniref:restriction endonuclease subunit S n=1 Tax=Vibrio metoecus TaxID=1481663 RepID=UPI000BA9C1DB|nr:restriction endonuclease subunit S [Vibrio metoecus]PAR27455.1 restriction endonuclease subunit S [Vibrio metoecus]PAR61244.1 restriction endonuclease subunit S [Vibrio metoecus]
MGKYQAYPEYKDSEIDWLETIPAHWHTSKLRYTFGFGKGLTITKENLRDTGIPCVSYGEVHSKYGFEIDPARHPLKCVGDDYLKTSPYALLKKGDIVFADTSEDIDGSGNFTQLVSNEQVFAGYHTIIARPYNRECSRFYAYLLDSKELRTQIRHAVKGVKVFSITQAILRGVSIWLPPLEERTQIANFLDHETAKIDTLIEKQQQLIKLLKEKRQAVISHAVTKGLNPRAPMKDSGVEWLGEVPEHWEVTSIKYQCALIDGDRGANYPNENDYVESGIPFFSSKNIVNYKLTKKNLNYISKSKFSSLGRGKLVHDDLIITVRGTIGHVAAFDSTNVGCDTGFINAQMMIIRPKKSLTDFLLYLSESDVWSNQLNLYSYGSTVKQLSNEVVGNFKFVLPHPDEMVPLLTYLKNIDDTYGKLIDKAQKQIRLMQERRTALISAAVTGKIDVRNWQAPTTQSLEHTT